MTSLIDTSELKRLAKKMEDDNPAKVIILSLPDKIDRKELAWKFDVILYFLDKKKEATS